MTRKGRRILELQRDGRRSSRGFPAHRSAYKLIDRFVQQGLLVEMTSAKRELLFRFGFDPGEKNCGNLDPLRFPLFCCEPRQLLFKFYI